MSDVPEYKRPAECCQSMQRSERGGTGASAVETSDPDTHFQVSSSYQRDTGSQTDQTGPEDCV